jgi:hypothetical protein
MMRSFTLEIVAGDLAFATGYLRITIGLLAATMNSAAALSIASGSAARVTIGHRLLDTA